MIQVKLIQKPKELTDEKIAILTANYKENTKRTVWKQPYIKAALEEMFNEKCCYCEVVVNEEGYGEIEHFYPKSIYPNEVVTWGNLMLCCSRCNKVKSNFDSKTLPFINPIQNNPKEHLSFRAFRFIKKTTAGENSIKVLKLNSDDRQKKRFKLYNQLNEQLNLVEEQFLLNQKTKNIDGLKLCQKSLIVILSTCSKTQKYSAITANLILNNDTFQSLKKYLETENLWNSELQKLENQAINIAL